MTVATEISSRPAGKDTHSPRSLGSNFNIIDIRRSPVEIDLKEDIVTLFHPKEGPRRLPTLLLYDERGLQLFEDASPSRLRSFPPLTLGHANLGVRSRIWRNTTRPMLKLRC